MGRYVVQKDNSHPTQDGVGWCEISSHYSELYTVLYLWIVYFWNFFQLIFWGCGWRQVTETVESETADKGELLCLALKIHSKYYQKNWLWYNIPVNKLMEVEKLTVLINQFSSISSTAIDTLYWERKESFTSLKGNCSLIESTVSLWITICIRCR